MVKGKYVKVNYNYDNKGLELLKRKEHFYNYNQFYFFFYKLINKFIKKGKKGNVIKIFNIIKKKINMEKKIKKEIYFFDLFSKILGSIKPLKGVKITRGYSFKKYYPKFLGFRESLVLSIKWIKDSLNKRRFRESILKEVSNLINKNKISNVMENKKNQEDLFQKSLPYRKKKKKKKNVKSRIETVKRL